MPDTSQLFSAKNLHPEWLVAWEFSIQDEILRGEMLENPRINYRIIDNIAKANKLTNIEPEQVSEKVSFLTKTIANDLEKFADICGLALMGQALRQLISPAQLSIYLEKFDLQTLQMALQANINYPGYSNVNFEPEHLNDVVRKAGLRTIAGWTWGLEPNIGGRIRMMLPAKFSSLSDLNETIDPSTAAQTVQAIAHLLNAPDTLQQAA